MRYEVELKIEGEQLHRLVWNFNHLVEAESVAGCNLMGSAAGASATRLRGFLYAFMKTQHAELLLGEAGLLLTKAPMACVEAIHRLFELVFPEPPEAVAVEPSAAPADEE